MKLHKLLCPNCNGMLDMNISDTTKGVFCPYCGQKFYVDDEKKEYTINKNININKTIHNRYTDDAEVERVRVDDKKDKRGWIFLAVLWGALAVIIIGVNLYFALAPKVAESQGKISAGYYRDLVGEDYETVAAHFEAAGFTNVELIDLDDAGLAFWNEGKVKTISVGGNTSFESTDYFDPDTKVVISYH